MTEKDPNDGLTSADIKKQIEAATRAEKASDKAKRELKDSGVSLTGMVANEINASESTPEPTMKTESKPDPETAAESKPTENVDLKEWAKKRGIDWTTEESVLAALRKSDQEFHKRQAEKKAKETNGAPPYGQPYPYPNAYPPVDYPPPAYQPPQRPVERSIIDQIAKDYNMLPEDAERLARFNRDFFEVAMRSEREKLQRQMDSMRVENQKNSVFRELSSDPVFRRPEVAVEYHRVLDEMQNSDPQSFEQNPAAYKRAFEIALSNIGRRNLEGQPLTEGVPPTARTVTPPMTPPRPLGKGSGGGSLENESGIDAKEFAKLPLEEKRKVLEKAGLRPAY